MILNLNQNRFDMEKKLQVRIVSIKEDSFSVDYDRLPETKEDCEKNVSPYFGISMSVNEEKSYLTAHAQVKYILTENSQDVDIVSLQYSYTLRISDIYDIIKYPNEKDKTTFEVQNKFIEKFVPDVFATGRALLAPKLMNTVLSDFYLPFGGEQDILRRIKENRVTKDKAD